MNQLRLRVAVVDDGESIRKAFERLMRSAGMDVDTFRSGAEFIDAIDVVVPACRRPH